MKRVIALAVLILCVNPTKAQVLKGNDVPWIEEKYCINEEKIEKRREVTKRRARQLAKNPNLFSTFIPTITGVIMESYMRDEYGVIRMAPEGGGDTIRITFFVDDIGFQRVKNIIEENDSGRIGVTGEVSEFRGESQIIVERECQIVTSNY